MVTKCSWNTVAERSENGHGCSGNRMQVESGHYSSFGMDALLTERSWSKEVILVLAWMQLGHGSYHGLGMDPLVTLKL